LKFQYPESWTIVQIGNINIQPEYLLYKGQYKLKIIRVQGGSEECVFNSNFDSGMADFFIDISKYNYKIINSKIGKFYYFNTGSQYEFCGPSANLNTKLVKISAAGLITFETPTSPDPELMKEMEDIISSIEE